MNAKRVFGALFFSSAFTQRNISSVILVGIFFLVFILAGGKIDTQPLPRANQAGAFGSVDADFSAADRENKRQGPSSEQALGIVPSEERDRRESSNLSTGRLFSNSDADEALQKPIDRDGLIKGYKKVYQSDRERRAVERSERYHRQEVDPLDAIQERLNRLK